MKLGIVIPVYNRPEYLRQCLDSVIRSILPEGINIVVVNDCSTHPDMNRILAGFAENLRGKSITFKNNRVNSGVAYSIKAGIATLLEAGCDMFINLDSDAIVRREWIDKIIELKNLFPSKIVTGFNCLTKNDNGTERHPITEQAQGYNFKKSVGGLNMCFDRTQYNSCILPALEKAIRRECNWDAEACKYSGGAACVVPSVVQHIGINSSMGHHETPDTADDFVKDEILPEVAKNGFITGDISEEKRQGNTKLSLPSVTLVTVNCDAVEAGIFAMNKSMEGIDFGSVKFLTSQDTDYEYAVKIPHIASIKEYSRFMVYELYKYIDTEFILVIQSDGYVMNPAAWTDDFLKYDYIGATWWFRDRHNVGNGGFSLRSKKLMEIVATDKHIRIYHPEDEAICRKYGRFLQVKHGIEFAPDNVAKKFSIEGWRQNDKTYIGQFGFHGRGVIFPGTLSGSGTTQIKQPERKPDIIVINQPFGLGDFLFCIPLMRDYINEGLKVIVPVIGQYDNINKHFHDILFINKEMLKINYERKDEYTISGMKVIPLRWSYEILKVPFSDCMKSKYMMFGKDWTRWRECTWMRDMEAEDELYYKVLQLKDGEQYNLINTTFRNDLSGEAKVNVNNGFKNVKMRTVPGFTLLDWGKVIENATTIHTVSTSINYMIELMALKAKEIHLYVRKPDEKDFRNINYLFTKHYHLHL